MEERESKGEELATHKFTLIAATAKFQKAICSGWGKNWAITEKNVVSMEEEKSRGAK